MTIIEKIYWIRLLLGIIAALASTGYAQVAGAISPTGGDINLLLMGVNMALIVHVISFYIMKFKWAAKMEKPHKIFTTGIGIYFLSWLVFWILFYTIMAGPPPPA